jgi:hypothetical protein
MWIHQALTKQSAQPAFRTDHCMVILREADKATIRQKAEISIVIV